MLMQSRPFFRKLTKLNIQPLYNCRRAVKSYRLSNGRKNTPHKSKSSSVYNQTQAIQPLYAPRLYKVREVLLNLLGRGQYSVISNVFGICTYAPYTKGVVLGDYLTTIRISNHYLTTSHTISPKNSQTLPLHDIVYGSRILGSKTTLFGVFKASGVLVLTNRRLPNIPASTLWFGFSSKLTVQITGITSKVRGIAKNPVDHPNGGRANTKGSFKTP